ncbi:hypothetical protein A0128_20575 [Leptospira tipperaryensis]|uniref:Uncharacterized protein n=1 Tax=Leptospira tipperaryensis TaxID=2564040 RepID=A0A1D7V3L4_9LEPT|nr:hypothetical protein A0128_20575 [Leptospira tipperaryensis]
MSFQIPRSDSNSALELQNVGTATKSKIQEFVGVSTQRVSNFKSAIAQNSPSLRERLKILILIRILGIEKG